MIVPIDTWLKLDKDVDVAVRHKEHQRNLKDVILLNNYLYLIFFLLEGQGGPWTFEFIRLI